jgi:TP901 family phage tail tape measure protein
MRQYLREIWVKFGLDALEYEKGLEDVKKKTQGFINTVDKSSKSLTTTGKAIGVMSGALIGIGAISLKTFGEFEQSMANTASVAGATSEELQKLSDAARNMGEISVFSASQAADAMYFLASAGLKTEQIISALPGTLQLAAATQADLADTTKVVVSTLSAFQMESEEANRISNVFAATISGSQATMHKLGEGMKYVAPVMNALGISVEQTSAALGILYNAGYEGSQAGTYLRQSMLSLTKPTQQAEKALNKYGLSAKDINPETNSLAEILDKLKSAGIGAKGSMGDLAAIFDKRAAPAMQVMLNAGSEGLLEFESQITGTTKAADMAATQIDTLQGTVKLLRSALEETAIQVGQRLAPAFRWTADAVKYISNIFNSLPNSMKDVLVMVPMIAAGFGAVISPVMLLIAKLPILISTFKLARVAMLTTLGPISMITMGIIALGVAIAHFSGRQQRATKELKDNINAANDAIGAQIEQQRSAKSLSSEYENLASKTNRTEAENRRMQVIYNKLRSDYPELITGTKDYASALSEVSKVGGEATKEIERLIKLQKENAKLVNTLKQAEAVTEIRKAYEELGDTDAFTKLSEGINSVFSQGNQLIPMLYNIESRLKHTSDAVRKSVSSTMLGLGKSGVHYRELTSNIEKYVISGKNEEEMLRRAQNVRSDMNNLVKEQIRLMALDNEFSVKSRDESVKLTNAEQKRWNNVKGNLGIVSAYISAYQTATKNVSNYTSKLQGLAELQNEISGIESPEMLEDDFASDSGTGDSIDNRKKRNKMLLQLEIEFMREKLEALKSSKDKEVEIAMQYADLEREIRSKEIELSRQDQIDDAKELGVSLSQINDITNQKIANSEQQHRDDMLEIQKSFYEKSNSLALNRLENDKSVTLDELVFFRSALVSKLEELKAAGKIWNAEYMNILGNLKKTDDIIGNVMTKNLKSITERGKEILSGMSEAIDENRINEYLTLAREYKQILLAELETIKKYKGEESDEYKNKMMEMSEFIKKTEKDRLKEIRHYANVSSEIFLSGFDTIWDSFVKQGENAQLKIKDILASMKQEFFRFLGDIVRKIIQTQLLKLFTNILGGGFGSLLGIGGAIPNPVQSSLGSFTKKSGVQFLHAGETIAKVNRASDSNFRKVIGSGYDEKITKDGLYNTNAGDVIIPKRITNEYENARFRVSGVSDLIPKNAEREILKPEKSTDVSDSVGKAENNIFNMTLVNPIVESSEYWDKVYADKIVPAINRNKKRFGV